MASLAHCITFRALRYAYGTTQGGGAIDACGDGGRGTVFKITPGGAFTTVYNFCSQSGCTDGTYPVAGLVQGADGGFYGTTSAGGANADGTVFKITPSGTLTTLYGFCSQNRCTDGYYPLAALVRANNGDFYGTAFRGGVSGLGTIFKITPSGAFTMLYTFVSHTGHDGAPNAALVQATDGNLYGGTPGPGPGTLFKITPNGTLTTLYRLCPEKSSERRACPNGEHPAAALVQGTDGELYGTASGGGTYGNGTVFSLSVGLGPFVETQTTSGEVGWPVEILGTNLTGASSVTFNGAAAEFTVNASGAAISATAPAGAATGTLQVVTLGGATLSTNMPFRVLP